MKPLISIVIPTYNVEKYIHQCLSSVLNQNFQHPYEVLIVDDCGNDQSVKIVEDIIVSHPRGGYVAVLHHERNKGLGPARNTGIDNAKGEYIFFLDSDDWLAPDCLEKLYNKIKESDADMVVGSVNRIEEGTGRLLSANLYNETIVETSGAGVYMVTHKPDFHIEVWNKLYKTDFLRRNKIRFVHRIFEDYYFDFRLRATSSKIALIPDITLYYNIRANSILTTLKTSHGSDESVYTFCEIIQYLQQMVKNEYSEVLGIYDLYIERVIWIFENFERYKYSKEQWAYISKHMNKVVSFVPSVNLLKKRKNRFVYLGSLGKDNIIILRILIKISKCDINFIKNKFRKIF